MQNVVVTIKFQKISFFFYFFVVVRFSV